MDFKSTYRVLIQRANLYFKKAMLSLSKSGNPSAIKVAAEYYVGLGAVDKQDNKITIINAMPQTDSDVDKLKAKINQDNSTEANDMIKEEFGV